MERLAGDVDLVEVETARRRVHGRERRRSRRRAVRPQLYRVTIVCNRSRNCGSRDAADLFLNQAGRRRRWER